MLYLRSTKLCRQKSKQTNKTKSGYNYRERGYCYVKIYPWFCTLQLNYNRPSPQRILATEMSRELRYQMPGSVLLNVSCDLTVVSVPSQPLYPHRPRRCTDPKLTNTILATKPSCSASSQRKGLHRAGQS